MRKGQSADDDQYSDEEATRRRDAVVRRMIATPPKPHKPAAKPKRASRAKRSEPKA